MEIALLRSKVASLVSINEVLPYGNIALKYRLGDLKVVSYALAQQSEIATFSSSTLHEHATTNLSNVRVSIRIKLAT